MYDELIVAKDGDVYIRLMTIRDTAKVLEWRNSPYVVNNFIFRETITEEMHEDYIRTKINEGEVIQFVIGSAGEEVGCVYFRDVDMMNATAEYGIFMSEAASGKGIGYKASMLAIKYMFDELDIKTISLRVLEKNAAAIHLYEKCGFTFDDKKETVSLDGNMENVLFMKICR